MKFLPSVFDSNEKQLSKIRATAVQIEALEKWAEELPQPKMHELVAEWKTKLKEKLPEDKDAFLDEILPQAFAIVREAAKRTIGKKHYRVQLIGGIVLHQGKIAEQKTGEGKTLTATSPLFLNSLTGEGAHLVTQNDYLATHHAAWMGPIYHYLGLKTGVISPESSYIYDPDFDNEAFLDVLSKKLKPISRREAYECDITYGTNAEFGFDYLRDNMSISLAGMSQSNPNHNLGVHNFAIVDEVDSLLIDVARTPLIISQPAEESSQKYYDIARMAKSLEKDTDFEMDEKHGSVTLTDLGVKRIERFLGVTNLYEKDFETVHHIEQALKAKALFLKDRDYVVKDGRVLIVDKFTGRILLNNRYSEGLHQAIEAKEGVEIQRENRTLAEVSYQNYFRMYKKLAGMTGTAETEAEEFHKIYGLEVVVIPTHKPMIRVDSSDIVYKSESAKFKAVADEISEMNKQGRPVLVGTTSVEKSEQLHELLKRKGVPHEILNAKNHEREALIIANAGRKGSVTVSTNMAGRGVDIILGGETPSEKEQGEIRNLGGLHVIGTERHESRRIDNQLRGRSGRQGDTGSSRFFVSLQDDLMRVFGGSMVEGLMDRFGMDENTPLESKLVSGAIENAQKKVEGHNFDIRKRVVDFDDVMNQQRDVIYKLRRKVLGVEEGFDKEWFIKKIVPVYDGDFESVWEHWEKRLGPEAWVQAVTQLSLQVIDTLWITHLEDMDDVMEGINLRGYAQKDPLVEYRKEGHTRFSTLVDTIYSSIAERLRLVIAEEEGLNHIKNLQVEQNEAANVVYQSGEYQSGVKADKEVHKEFKVESVKSGVPKVGRNDPCPCGKTKPDGTPVKYKNCHGKGL